MSVDADKEADAIALVYKSEDKWKGHDECSSVCYIATRVDPSTSTLLLHYPGAATLRGWRKT
jgi:hypothetical protein